MNYLSKTHCLAVLALALALVIAAPALADDARGTLAFVNADNHTFTLVDENNDVLTMRLLVGSQVLINDREATIWDLQPGDSVSVTYDRPNYGEMEAKALECRRIE